jgi:hypothetical protein
MSSQLRIYVVKLVIMAKTYILHNVRIVLYPRAIDLLLRVGNWEAKTQEQMLELIA